jgi:hypothetical protein
MFVFTMQSGRLGLNVTRTIRNEITVPNILKMVDLSIDKNLAALKLRRFVVKMLKNLSRSSRFSQSTIPKVLSETRKIVFWDSSTISSHFNIVINVGTFNNSKP